MDLSGRNNLKQQEEKTVIIIIYNFIKHTIIHSYAIKDAVQNTKKNLKV